MMEINHFVHLSGSALWALWGLVLIVGIVGIVAICSMAPMVFPSSIGAIEEAKEPMGFIR